MTAATARAIFAAENGAFPSTFPVTPLTRKRKGLPPYS